MGRRTYQLAFATTVLTYGLILLGEFTAVSASGATCNQFYPLCSSYLHPLELPLHKFIEWFHRFIAMILGFFVLGTFVAIWRNYSERSIRLSGLFAFILLLVQAFLGAVTVTAFGDLIPFGYAPITQTTHHFAALALFATLIYTTLRLRERNNPGRSGLGSYRSTAVAGLVLLPLQLVFSRNTIFSTYGIRIQLANHAFELLVFTAALVALIWAYRNGVTRIAQAMAIAVGFVTVQIILGTGIVPFSPTVQLTYYLLSLGVAGLLAATIYTSTDRESVASSA